jgi:hypothetical protein
MDKNPLENLVGLNQLESYTDEVKKYVKSQGVGMTEEDVKAIISENLVYSDEEPQNQSKNEGWMQEY